MHGLAGMVANPRLQHRTEPLVSVSKTRHDSMKNPRQRGSGAKLEVDHSLQGLPISSGGQQARQLNTEPRSWFPAHRTQSRQPPRNVGRTATGRASCCNRSARSLTPRNEDPAGQTWDWASPMCWCRCNRP
jgi:hypothetical protein